MKKLIFTSLLLLAAMAGNAEKPTDYKLDIQDFTELNVVDGIMVDYATNPDSVGMAVFTCAPEVASEIIFTNDNNQLTVRTAADEKTITGIPHIKVYSSMLKKVVNSGDSIVRVYVSIPVKEFKARQIGNGTLEIHALHTDNLDAGVTAGNGTLKLDGIVKKAKINNVSTGPVIAANLLANNISCFVFGSGDIECAPAEALRVYGAGSGRVLYHGSPKVTMRSIGVKAVSADKQMAMMTWLMR